MAGKKRWYSMRASTVGAETVAEIRIYDEIGFWGTTAKSFVEELERITEGANSILLAINSPGGDVFDAFAIYNALRRHALKVTARVDGIAASAASLILMAGDEIVMPENAMIMIHNPWTFAVGESKDLRKAADMMDDARDGIVAAYTAKCGKPAAEIIQMMDETTWMTALDAQAMGFCDVIEEPVKMAASATAVDLLAKLDRVPADLLAKLEASLSEPPANASSAAPTAGTLEPLSTVSASEINRFVINACRDRGIADLVEAVLLTCSLESKELAQLRIDAAAEISALCVVAKLPEKASDFVMTDLSVEQVRARLFEAVTARSADSISNLQRPDDGAQPKGSDGPTVRSIYAARSAVRFGTPRH